MLYHVSDQQGLKVLEPRVSTHGKAYVYAIENLVTGLLFGTKQDDFDFLLTTYENKRPTVFECYPDAFRTIYQGKGCSVYVLDETGFLRGMTSWSPELVCESSVAVQEEIPVPDLYERLLEEEAAGTLVVRRYEYSDEYRKMIAGHVVDRLIRFGIKLEGLEDRNHRFATHYKELLMGLRSVLDGHLLK